MRTESAWSSIVRTGRKLMPLDYNDAGLARATYAMERPGILLRIWRWIKRKWRKAFRKFLGMPGYNDLHMISGLCPGCGSQAPDIWICFGQKSWLCTCGLWWPVKRKKKRKRRR